MTRMSRELGLFIAASLAMGMAYSIIDATFNNFLNERFALSGFERSFLEFPREIPGFLVVFASALLWFLCSRRLATLAMLLGGVGTALIGFASPGYAIMVLWLFIYSLGQHIFLPLSSSIGMELSEKGKTGTGSTVQTTRNKIWFSCRFILCCERNCWFGSVFKQYFKPVWNWTGNYRYNRK